MIPFAWCLLIVGLALLPIAVRGRVFATGQFCRKCRFDLAGLSVESEHAKCPECGRSIVGKSTHRASLRRRSLKGLVISALLMVVAAILLGVNYSGNTARIYAQFPDLFIVHLSILGDEDASDELATRLIRKPPVSDPLWERMIHNAMKAQANPDQQWEPIFGEILGTALFTGRLSPEETVQYFRNAVETEFVIRDSIPQGSTEIVSRFLTTPGRVHAYNNDQTGKRLTITVMSTKVGTEQPRRYGADDAGKNLGSYQIGIPNQYSHWSYTSALRIEPVESQIDAEVGSTIQVDVHYQISLSDDPNMKSSGTPDTEPMLLEDLSITRDILVTDPQTPLVELVDDAQLASEVCNLFGISQMRLTRELDPDRQNWMPILGCTMQLKSKLDIPCAFRVFLVVDGEEFEIRNYIQETTEGGFYGTVADWRPDTDDPETKQLAQELITKLSQTKVVDVIFRTEPTVADSNPVINQVIDTTLVFRGVSVELVDQYSQIWNMPTSLEWFSPECDD